MAKSCGSCEDFGSGQILSFRSPSIVNNKEVFTTEFTVRGYLKSGVNPREVNQDSLQVGIAYYTLHLRYNSLALNVKPSWQVVVVTMNDIQLQLIGPPVDVDGRHQYLRFLAAHVV